MRKLLCLSVPLFIFCAPGLAQNQPARIDSMLAKLTVTADDAGKVDLLANLGKEYLNINTGEAAKYAGQALALAEKLEWPAGIALAKEVLGRTHWRKGNFQEALPLHFEALAYWQQTDSLRKIALLNDYLGQDYADSGNYPEAIKYLAAALAAKEKSDNKPGQIYTNFILSWVYDNMGMYPESVRYLYAALKLAEETRDKYSIAMAYSYLAEHFRTEGNYAETIKIRMRSLDIYREASDFINLATTYNGLGATYANLKNYDEALKNHELALEVGQQIKNGGVIGEAYSYIGEVYRATGNYALALSNFRSALREFASVDNKAALAKEHIHIGACFTKMGNYGEAKRSFDVAFALSKSLETVKDFNYYYQEVVQLDSASGNWKNAFEHYKLFVSTRDSMYNEDNTRKLVQSRMQYDFDKKEAAAKAEQEKKDALNQQELQRQKLMRNGFMGGFGVVVLFAGVFFTQRNRIKKGKARSDELLLNILPAEVADELKARGTAEAKMFDEVTVLFSDFKGFTQLSATLTPRELVAELNACFSAFDLIMQKHGVEKIKTVGDAYMAAGGLPTPNATHATDVLAAALDMQAFMAERKTAREAEGKFCFEARIGMHTGPVVAGIVGVKKFAYDIWGDTVNTAQRMESSGEAGRVNVSGSTFAWVKNRFNCIYRGKIETKGKGEMDMYFVEG